MWLKSVNKGERIRSSSSKLPLRYLHLLKYQKFSVHFFILPQLPFFLKTGKKCSNSKRDNLPPVKEGMLSL